MIAKCVLLLTTLFTCLVWLEYIYLRRYNIHKLLAPECYDNPFSNYRALALSTSSPTREKTIVFAGLARDIENNIESSIENCVLLGSFFKSYRIVIFENDSVDKTRECILKVAQRNKNVHLIECKGYDDCKLKQREMYTYGIMHENRIDRMAYFRNVYLSIVYEQFSSHDYLCVMDFDIEGIVPLSGLLHALNCPHEWACICANGRSSIPGTFGMMTTMYDAMALCTSPEEMEMSANGPRTMFPLFLKYLKLLYLSNVQDEKDGFIKVHSAFNGFAIYKMKDILGLYYLPGFACEHVSLHKQLIERNKNIFIDRFLEIFVGHQGPENIADFFKTS